MLKMNKLTSFKHTVKQQVFFWQKWNNYPASFSNFNNNGLIFNISYINISIMTDVPFVPFINPGLLLFIFILYWSIHNWSFMIIFYLLHFTPHFLNIKNTSKIRSKKHVNAIHDYSTTHYLSCVNHVDAKTYQNCFVFVSKISEFMK